MQIRNLVGFAVLALAVHSAALSAQACLGLPSFQDGAFRINAAVELPDSATGIAVGVGAGKPNSVFGTIGGGQVSYEGFDEKTRLVFAEVGYQVPLSRAQLCPVAGASLTSGPDDDLTGIKLKGRSLAGGLALGVPLTMSGFTLIPNAAVRYELFSLDIEDESVGVTVTEDSKGAVLDLGVALVLFSRVSVQPLMHIPFASDADEEEDPSFGIFVSIALGRRSR